MKKMFIMLALTVGLIGCGSSLEQPKDQVTKEGSVNVKKVQKAEKNENIVVIDTRSYDEYNGWDLEGNGIHGHIPGAVSFPTVAITEDNLEKGLERKGIKEGNKIIVYGKESNIMAEKLAEKGYMVSIFDGGVEAWAKKSLSFVANSKLMGY